MNGSRSLYTEGVRGVARSLCLNSHSSPFFRLGRLQTAAPMANQNLAHNEHKYLYTLCNFSVTLMHEVHKLDFIREILL